MTVATAAFGNMKEASMMEKVIVAKLGKPRSLMMSLCLELSYF
jgi:hypothetical protein